MVCLFRPMLLLSAAVPQRNYVGVLVDDSRSMRIADRTARRAATGSSMQFGGPDSVLLKKLREKFIVRLFSFSSGAQRVDSLRDLTFNASETHLGDAIEQARQELDGGAAVRSRRALATAPTTRARRSATSCLSLRAKSRADLRRRPRRRQVRQGHRDPSRRSVALGAEGRRARRGSAGSPARLCRRNACRSSSKTADRSSRAIRSRCRRTATSRRFASRSSRTTPARGQFTFRIPVQKDEQVEQNNVAAGASSTCATAARRFSTSKASRVTRCASFARRSKRIRTFSSSCCSAPPRTSFCVSNVDSADELATGFPKIARGAVRLSRDHRRQHRGELLHARSARDARRLRERARRRADAARRPSLVRRRRIRGNAARRRDAGRRSQGECGCRTR